MQSPDHRAAASQAPPPRRVSLLDGLRGIAIVLVVLSHLGTVWPEAPLWDLGPAAGLLHSGNIGVTVFLVVSGFLVTPILLERRTHGTLEPGRYVLHRLVRISAQVYALLAVVLVVAQADPTDTNSPDATTNSVVAAATYTWNEYVRQHPFESRSDLGPLYYLSIETQFFVALALLVMAIGLERRLLAAVLGVALLLVTAWRWQIYANHGWYDASLMTSTRIDGLLWGALAALAAPRLSRRLTPSRARLVLATALAALAAVVGTAEAAGVGAYYGWQAVAANLACAAACVAAPLARAGLTGSQPGGVVERVLERRELVWLGRASLSVFIWHLPVFEAVARNTPEWSPLMRTALAGAIVAAVVAAAERWVARPVTAWTAGFHRPASGRHRLPAA